MSWDPTQPGATSQQDDHLGGADYIEPALPSLHGVVVLQATDPDPANPLPGVLYLRISS
jgi:hypothetical protein